MGRGVPEFYILFNASISAQLYDHISSNKKMKSESFSFIKRRCFQYMGLLAKLKYFRGLGTMGPSELVSLIKIIIIYYSLGKRCDPNLH